MSADLFQAALERRLAEQGPLAARMRPESLDEMVGQQHLLGPGRPLRALVEADRLSSAILWGPPGTGKTTLARLIAGATKRAFVGLSAVSAGVKDVRETAERARRLLGEQGRGTVLFLDEVHRFNRAQQDALLPSVEAGELTLVGATTENPFFSVNGPLLSRSSLFRLEALSEEEILVVLHRALEHVGASADQDALAFLARSVEGDARAALNGLEVALALAEVAGGAGVERATGGAGVTITLARVEAARSTRAVRYGEDEHYDIVSAFIKSIRGSDPDAGLYWLARMLEAGEDARFIARRLVILASEDVGMADPGSLLMADAAARAVEFVGLPEAQLNLAHAVVHLANAPKSNSVTAALGEARADAASLRAGEVPEHLRDAHYQGAARLGHGKGYVYPHDQPGAWAAQQYRPAHLEGRSYWHPTGRGQDLRRAGRGEGAAGGGESGAGGGESGAGAPGGEGAAGGEESGEGGAR
ncbi:MAG: replication-associated recombination protein A [Acidimicrobiales bacterium]